MIGEEIVLPVFGALVGSVVTAVLVHALAVARGAAIRAELEQLRRRKEELLEERNQERLRKEALALRVSELETRQAADQERLQWLARAETSLRETFESLAGRTLRESTTSLLEQSKVQLTQFSQLLKSDWGARTQELRGVVSPLAEELKKLDHQVRTLEERRQGAYQGLTEQVRTIGEQYRSLHQATTSLDQALRAPQVRGKWGEIQLRRLVEMAGMVDHVDFQEQTGGSEGIRKTPGDRSGTFRGRPDMIIRMPSEGVLPVDAKAPMSAYLDSQEAATPELASQALRRHAQALRGHIQALSQKAYWSQFERTPEFVVMVVPYESGLTAAFTTDPEILEYALANKVIISAPASFLALLQVIAYGWMQVDLSRNAREIAAGGRELLERLQPFASHMNRLGGALHQAVERFNESAGSFERRVLPTARKLQELGAGREAPQALNPLDSRPRTLSEESLPKESSSTEARRQR
ncbi:DNA recombination protein RmuC [Alkalispirochaeta americana]|uniref:DNA recombination protein RmuC n=1 Tax=Alkalispirochaeta americana TaxID=159291 RepID=A0A1N6QHQ1_9SPIO|nr:DNA recombination protein RmuC [Alkalispirochaeta americana]SIQ16153.1 DNA recombination protein RmuC [Alkalispirochaeta americana]